MFAFALESYTSTFTYIVWNHFMQWCCSGYCTAINIGIINPPYLWVSALGFCLFMEEHLWNPQELWCRSLIHLLLCFHMHTLVQRTPHSYITLRYYAIWNLLWLYMPQFLKETVAATFCLESMLLSDVIMVWTNQRFVTSRKIKTKGEELRSVLQHARNSLCNSSDPLLKRWKGPCMYGWKVRSTKSIVVLGHKVMRLHNYHAESWSEKSSLLDNRLFWQVQSRWACITCTQHVNRHLPIMPATHITRPHILLKWKCIPS